MRDAEPGTLLISKNGCIAKVTEISGSIYEVIKGPQKNVQNISSPNSPTT